VFFVVITLMIFFPDDLVPDEPEAEGVERAQER